MYCTPCGVRCIVSSLVLVPVLVLVLALVLVLVLMLVCWCPAVVRALMCGCWCWYWYCTAPAAAAGVQGKDALCCLRYRLEGCSLVRRLAGLPVRCFAVRLFVGYRRFAAVSPVRWLHGVLPVCRRSGLMIRRFAASLPGRWCDSLVCRRFAESLDRWYDVSTSNRSVGWLLGGLLALWFSASLVGRLDGFRL